MFSLKQSRIVIWAACLSGLLTACNMEQAPAFQEVKGQDLSLAKQSAGASADATAANGASTSANTTGQAAAADKAQQVITVDAEADAAVLPGTTDSASSAQSDASSPANTSTDTAAAAQSPSGTQTSSVSQSGAATQSQATSDGDSQAVTDAEKSDCAEYFSTSTDKLIVINGHPSVSLSPDAVLVVKVAGNQPSLDLSLVAKSGTAPLSGLCLIVTGNRPQVKVQLQASLAGFYFMGRGNSENTSVNVEAGAEMENAFASLAGNHARLEVSGEGKYACPTLEDKGNSPEMVCGD